LIDSAANDLVIVTKEIHDKSKIEFF
jgi:hypothetical protein